MNKGFTGIKTVITVIDLATISCFHKSFFITDELKLKAIILGEKIDDVLKPGRYAVTKNQH
jgi:hypothetical protein